MGGYVESQSGCQSALRRFLELRVDSWLSSYSSAWPCQAKSKRALRTGLGKHSPIWLQLTWPRVSPSLDRCSGNFDSCRFAVTFQRRWSCRTIYLSREECVRLSPPSRGSFPVVAISIAFLWSGIGRPLGASTIFDDDWAPPKPSAPVPSVVPTTERSDSQAPQPATTPATPTLRSDGAETSTAMARLPVPAAADKAKARKLLRQVFAVDLSDRSIPARAKLAARLLGEADKAADNPIDRYVLLGEGDPSCRRRGQPSALHSGGGRDVEDLRRRRSADQVRRSGEVGVFGCSQLTS